MKAELLRVIEAAYREAADEETWLRGMLEAASPLLDHGMGVLAFTYQLSPAAVQPGHIVQVGGSPHRIEPLRRSIAEGPQQLVRESFSRSRVLTLTEFIGRLEDAPFLEPYRTQLGCRDALGVFHVDPLGRGIVFNAFLSEPQRLSPAFRRAWSCIAAHVGAGFRLRQAAAARTAPPEAVLDAGGKLQHAQGDARDRDARSALRQAARAIDRARSAQEPDPNTALELWKALVEQRWSLVDRFDSDGRHFLVARRNPLPAPVVRELSVSERRVAALAALGRSNKLIAYELGLSTGTVGTLLSRAARKLGVGSRSELIAYWHARQRAGAEEP